jgi:hypothetical protein
MLFSKAASYLELQLGRPTAVVRSPTRRCNWRLPRGGRGSAMFEVTLACGPTPDMAVVRIIDPHDGVAAAHEEITILQEADIQLAVEHVRSHLEA